MKRYFLIFSLFAPLAFGQTVRVDIPIQTYGPTVPTSSGPLPQTLWVANATVNLCTHPSATLAACQAAPLTTYTDSTGGTTCATATPLVQLPGSTCTASTGAASNIGFWYGGGSFDYWITTNYGSFGPFSGTGSSSTPGCFSSPLGVTCGGTGATTAAGAALNLSPRSALNVMNYGAKCDGITVDTTAIQAGFTAAGAGGTVLIPTNSTCITGPLTMPGFFTLRGENKFNVDFESRPGYLRCLSSSPCGCDRLQQWLLPS